MIGFACEVAAKAARAGVPELIAEALAEDNVRLADDPAEPRVRPASVEAEQEVTT
jgi:hypothetical protein